MNNSIHNNCKNGCILIQNYISCIYSEMRNPMGRKAESGLVKSAFWAETEFAPPQAWDTG